MPIHGIDHYNLRLERTLMRLLAKFYVDVVGLEVGRRPAFKSEGIWLYSEGRDVLHLTEEHSEDKRRIGSDLTFDHVAFVCSDWPAVEARLKAADIDYEIDEVPDTQIRQVFFRDPAGNGVELIFKP